MVFFALGIRLAQAQSPKVFEPGVAKIGEQVTLEGTQLGVKEVTEIYLSAEKGGDYRAMIVKQDEQSIVFTVPKVAPGLYSVSLMPASNSKDILWYESVKLRVEP